MPLKCECEGFEDCWNYGREEHFTRTVHEEDCPNHPERWAEDKADHDYDIWKDERYF